MFAIRKFCFGLTLGVLAISAFAKAPGADSAHPLAAVDRNRTTLIADIVSALGNDLAPPQQEALREQLKSLRADTLLAASLASSRASLQAVINSAQGAAAPPSGAHQKLFGDLNKDLVYNPLTPCRLVDTRGFGAPIQGGAFAPGARRSYVPAGLCGIPTSNVASLMISFTTQNHTPTSGGYLAMLAPAAPVTATVDIFNLNSEWSASNTVVATGSAGQFDVYVAAANPEVVIDILGYFSPPSSGSVGTLYLADSAVATAKIADQAVTGAKIANSTITGAKIDSSTTITAAAFAYSNPVSGTYFATPQNCQRVQGAGPAYPSDVIVWHLPLNSFSPSIGSNSTVDTNIQFNCHVDLPRPAGASVSLTGGSAAYFDSSTNCRVQADLSIRGFPGALDNTVLATVHSGTNASDFGTFAFGAMLTKPFVLASPVTIGPTTIVYVLLTIGRAVAASAGDCRYGGAMLTYTVDRP